MVAINFQQGFKLIEYVLLIINHQNAFLLAGYYLLRVVFLISGLNFTYHWQFNRKTGSPAWQ